MGNNYIHISKERSGGSLLRQRRKWLGSISGLLIHATVINGDTLLADSPILSAPTNFGTDYIQVLGTNCNDPNSSYVLQSSGDLQQWLPMTTNAATPTFLPFVVPTTNGTSFYRITSVPRIPFPLFAGAITCQSNFNANGKKITVDSFDSTDINYSRAATGTLSNSVVWIYDAAKAKSGGDVSVNAGISGSLILGSGTINGHVYTGPGAMTNVVQLGPHAAIGEVPWSATDSGIEFYGMPQSWWLPNCHFTLPDVHEPTYTGLPLPSLDGRGNVVLNGGNYTVSSSSGSPTGSLIVIAPTTIWLQQGGSIGVTMANTNASLTLYVGRATGTSTSISLSGNGTMNQPGYARNLMIYGLSSCTSMSLYGNAGWTACIYAPSADVTAGGGGNNTQEVTGSIVARTLTLRGNWQCHYDESLKSLGPIR